MNHRQNGAASSVSSLFQGLAQRLRLLPSPDDVRARDRRQPWGRGTGRASYPVVQRRRAANRRARVARRITRRAR